MISMDIIAVILFVFIIINIITEIRHELATDFLKWIKKQQQKGEA